MSENDQNDYELEKIRLKKAEMLLKMQSFPQDVIEVRNSSHFNEITQKYSDNVIVVDFWAIWCNPCMLFAPVFKKIQEEYKGKGFIFLKVNVDENQEIARTFGITGIPTTLFMKGSQIVRKIVGLVNYDTMKKLLEKIRNN